MNYIEETKSEGEEILKYFNINKWAYLPVIFEILFGIALFFISAKVLGMIDFNDIAEISSSMANKAFNLLSVLIILKGVYDYLLLKSLNMGITDKRIVYKKGIIARHTNEIRLEAIETVDVSQSILGRLLGYGTVNVTGKGDSIISFDDIDEPILIKKDIGSVLNHYSQK